MPFFVYSYGKQTTVQRENFIFIWHMQLLMNTAVLILMGSLIIIQIEKAYVSNIKIKCPREIVVEQDFFKILFYFFLYKEKHILVCLFLW